MFSFNTYTHIFLFIQAQHPWNWLRYCEYNRGQAFSFLFQLLPCIITHFLSLPFMCWLIMTSKSGQSLGKSVTLVCFLNLVSVSVTVLDLTVFNITAKCAFCFSDRTGQHTWDYTCNSKLKRKSDKQWMGQKVALVQWSKTSLPAS